MLIGFFGDTPSSSAAPAAAPAASAAPMPAAPAAPMPTAMPPAMAPSGARVPFERPAQASSSYVPRSLDTGFIPEFNPFPMIMQTQMIRVPGNIHHPLTAEPGVLPTPAASVTAQPPSPTAIKHKSMHMMPVHLLMALGIFPGPRMSGGIRGGLDPSQLVKGGRNPGV